MEDIDFPTPICHIEEEHRKHIIPGTWRTQCPGKTKTTKDSRHLTASVVILNENWDKVLLVHHALTDKWQFPGGHVEENEEPGACAMREAMEETGVTVTQAGVRSKTHGAVQSYYPPFAVAEFEAPADPEWNEPAHHHIDFLYIAVADENVPLVPQEGEVKAARWFPIPDLSYLKVTDLPDNIRIDVGPMARRARRAFLVEM